jgi:hypothetical protein
MVTGQGIGANDAAGNAYLSVANPVAGRWEVDVQLDLTVSGKEFTQAVSGTFGYDEAVVDDYGTLPTSTSTTTKVKGRTFTLVPTGTDITDITGGAVAAGVYLPPGVTGLLTANLVPTAKAGTVAGGTLDVVSDTSVPKSPETIAALPYTYTVG